MPTYPAAAAQRLLRGIVRPSKLQKCPTGIKAVPFGLTEDRNRLWAVPGFGQSEKRDQSTIHNMLRNRAAVGEFQKRRNLNGKETPVGEPVPNYYPAVIDEDLFRVAQGARVEKLSGRLSPVLHPAMGKESRKTELSTFGPQN